MAPVSDRRRIAAKSVRRPGQAMPTIPFLTKSTATQRPSAWHLLPKSRASANSAEVRQSAPSGWKRTPLIAFARCGEVCQTIDPDQRACCEQNRCLLSRPLQPQSL